MLRTIAWVLGAFLILGGCWWFYKRANSGKDVPVNGDVFIRNVTPDATAKDQPEPAPPAPEPTPAPAAATTTQTATTQTTATPAAATTTPEATPRITNIAKPSDPLPVADSQIPNNPNGQRFGGTGQYQWYRQGNITYRVNTQTGASCVAFATDEEWRKPRVISRGCGNA